MYKSTQINTSKYDLIKCISDFKELTQQLYGFHIIIKRNINLCNLLDYMFPK